MITLAAWSEFAPFAACLVVAVLVAGWAVRDRHHNPEVKR